MKPVSVVVGLSTLVKTVVAWGASGHEAVGFVAMEFLAPKALDFVQTSLAGEFNSSLGTAGPWADTVRSEAAYKWSAPLHFVDAEDSPLQGQCSVSENRDCGDGECILTAIANYTSRVVDDSLSTDQRTEALKFLDHFIGDIGQPLHVEALEVGGNDIDAICSGKSTNLHAAWDTGMVQKNIDDSHGGTPQSYASDLAAEIKTGSFKSQAASWISCSSTTEPVTSSSRSALKSEIGSVSKRATITPLACPLVWAADANSFDCTAVFNFQTGEDLCTSAYFDAAVPIIDMQIAKQGYRLAAWLNVLFDGDTNL